MINTIYKILLIITISNNYNLFAQGKTSFDLKNVFPEEYIKIDKELCWIIYNHIIYNNTNNINIDSNIVNKIKKGKASKNFSIIHSVESNSKNEIDLSFEKKWWNDFTFSSTNNGIGIQWNNNSATVEAVFKKEYINSFRKDTYNKKQDLALTLLSNSAELGKHIINNINLDSIKMLRTKYSFTKINDSIYLSQIEKYNNFNNSIYFKKNNTNYELLYHKKYPIESITNILLSNDWFYTDTIDVNLRHKLYANDEVNHTINLSILNKLFSEETKSYITFVDSGRGTNSYKVNQLKITNNKQIVHLLKYEIPKDQLFNKNKINITATLYSNIRLDNLADIDKELKNKEPKIKIKL